MMALNRNLSWIWMTDRAPYNIVCLDYLVYLVYLVYSVYLVYLVYW